MPRQDVSEERKNQILDAAMNVFSRAGFHQARMDDIAQESGLSKGALYLYYKSKDAIIEALLRRFGGMEMRGIRATLQKGGTATERLFTMTRMFAADLDHLALAMPVMLEFYAAAARQRSVRQYMSGLLQEYAQLMIPVVEEGIRNGEFRAVSASDVAMTLIAFYEGLILLWVVDPRAIHWRDQAERSLRLMLDGIMAHEERSDEEKQD